MNYDEIVCFFFQTIGQSYDDMQTQNQQLLQQITERDDYNIKVITLDWFFVLNALFVYIH